jgi:hypothetical protein
LGYSGDISGQAYSISSSSFVEGIGGRDALSRSKALTKDRRGRIFFLELGFGLLFFLVIVIPVALLILLVGVMLENPFIGFSQPRPAWAEGIQLFGNVISEGLFVIFNVLLFKSLRGLDKSPEEIGWKKEE